jgi:hypothetical protein
MMHNPLLLAQHGQPLFEIMLPAGASPAEEFAADELGRALYAMIGPGARQHGLARAGRPRLFINDPQAAARAGVDVGGLALGREAFHLETRDNNLYLLGGGPRGVLYGVYDLLESLGCRWYTPEISHIPRRANLSLPALCKTGAPAFENRDAFNSECRDPLWRVRNRMNGWSTPAPEYMGGFLDYCGFVHTFYSLLPPEEFFDTHPEYYSLVGGQRRRDLAQLCLTNPDVLRIVTQRLLDLMRENPLATIFSVSQNDCYGFCECDRCRAVAEAEGAQSGPIIRFVNGVAAETSKHYPDKLIDTLAYQYSLDAPRISVPHPNVRVRLCSISCCQGHTYGTCDHPESRRFLRALQEWAARMSQMYIWHYATDFTHYPLPMPDFDELHGNINLYKRSGVSGLFIQGMGEPGVGAESMALRGYVVSKLLWQPDQPVWPLVDEFLAAYYGAAAPRVREYLDIFHNAVRQDVTLHPSLYDTPAARQFDDALRLPADRALAQAETLVSGEQRQRVRLLRGGLRYARLFRACGTFRRSGDVYAGTAQPGDLPELDDLVGLWKKAGVQRIREAEDFDFSVQKHRSRLRPHTVEWLGVGAQGAAQGAEQRIAVVPDLGGRLIEWQAGGHQWLAPADPDSTWSLHPFSGGYSETVLLGMYISRGWGETYRASWRSGRLHLSARIGERIGNHLLLTRQMWWQDGALHLRSQLTNRGTLAVECGWGAAMRYALPAEARVAFQDADGENGAAWDSLPTGATLNFTGEKAPRGDWQILLPGAQIQHSLRGAPLASFSLGKPGADGRLAVDWRTAIRPLAPGERLAVEQVIRIANTAA